MLNIILIGAPGSGKGTAAGLFKVEWGMVHLSTGDLLRSEIKKGSELGRFAASFLESGRLLPDEVMMQIMAERIRQPDARQCGVLYDGFPRTLAQAEAFDRMLAEHRQRVDGALMLDVAEEVILSRLTARRVCQGCGAVYNAIDRRPRQEGVCDQCGGAVVQRPDDTQETVRRRIATYEHDTLPVIEHYGRQGVLLKVNPGRELSTVVPAIRAWAQGLLDRRE